MGLPAPLLAAGLVLGRRARVRRRAEPFVLLAPSRRLHRRDVRRPGVRLAAGERAVGVRVARLAARRVPARPPRSAADSPRHSRRSTSRRSTPPGACAAPASRWRRSTIWHRSGRSPTRPRRREVARRLDAVDLGLLARRLPERRAAGAGSWPGRGARLRGRVRPRRASRTTPRTAWPPTVPSCRIPPAPESGRSGYAPWSEGLGEVLHRLAESLPDKPLLVAEHGVGTDDDAGGSRCCATRSARSSRRSTTASTCAASSTGPASTTTSGHYGFDVPFGLFDRDRDPKTSAALAASFARAGLRTAAG